MNPTAEQQMLADAVVRQQRRARWLLWVTVVVLAIGGNRWVTSCQRGFFVPFSTL